MSATTLKPMLRLAVRSAVIGLLVAASLNLLVLLVPLPDALVQLLVALQVLGVRVEISRATPYHLSAFNAFLTNAAAYSVVTFVIALIRRRRLAVASRAV